MSLGDTNANNSKDISNLFAKHFSSVYESHGHHGHDPGSASETILPDIGNLSLSTDVICKTLAGLDLSKGAGPDNIPPIFWSRCARPLCFPLANIFNTSLRMGIFPNTWKRAKIVPIHKNGKREEVTNYRPISILSTVSKVFESLVYPLVYNHIKNYLSNSQHGFILKRSTNTNLVTYVTELVTAVDQGHQVDAIYTDFSRAFDKVNHDLLLFKLQSMGITNSALDWFRSYLASRQSTVVVDGDESDAYLATSGVPQGSHLGPLLFNVFINDLPIIFKHSTPYLFADDLKLVRAIREESDTQLLQSDINRLHQWCRENDMHVNCSKCYHIKFTRKRNIIQSSYDIQGTILSEVSVIKDLGIYLDNQLRFVEHIDKTIAAAFRALGFVLRCSKEFKNASTVLLLYNSYVRSRLEYCSTVWSPTYQIHASRIESVQKRLVRHLAFRLKLNYSVTSYEDRLNHFKMSSLQSRRTVSDLIFLYKLVNGHIDCPELLSKICLTVPYRVPRHPRALLKAPRSRTNLGKHSPIVRMSNQYNTASMATPEIDIFANSLGKFRNLLSASLPTRV